MSNSSKSKIKISKPQVKRTSLSLTEKEIEMFTARAYTLGFTGIQQYLVYLARVDCERQGVSVSTQDDIDSTE